MAVEMQFLLVEFLVACAAITSLLAILALVFWSERRMPGPVFSRHGVREATVDRESIKYHDAEREAARTAEKLKAVKWQEEIAVAIADKAPIAWTNTVAEVVTEKYALTA